MRHSERTQRECEGLNYCAERNDQQREWECPLILAAMLSRVLTNWLRTVLIRIAFDIMRTVDLEHNLLHLGRSDNTVLWMWWACEIDPKKKKNSIHCIEEKNWQYGKRQSETDLSNGLQVLASSWNEPSWTKKRNFEQRGEEKCWGTARKSGTAYNYFSG